MKKLLLAMTIAIASLLLVTACGKTADRTPENLSKSSSASETTEAGNMQKMNGERGQGKKILVVYFSRTGENYAVGNISKGNTHIVADMIAEATGADSFEIKTVKPYPENYKECTEVAKKELAEAARPELAAQVTNMSDYDIIFLGYPIWWSDMPMPIYSFLESYDFKGKTIIPFCTSAGDVLTGKERNIPQYAKGATVLKGLGIEGKRAQNDPNSVRTEVQQWITKIGLGK